jgi:hypothetical protein
MRMHALGVRRPWADGAGRREVLQSAACVLLVALEVGARERESYAGLQRDDAGAAWLVLRGGSSGVPQAAAHAHSARVMRCTWCVHGVYAMPQSQHIITDHDI